MKPLRLGPGTSVGTSLPVRGRGLKPVHLRGIERELESLPVRGRGLKLLSRGWLRERS